MKLRVFERIGAGGSGEIYRGMLLPERRSVAVKRLAKDHPEHRRRLRDEAEVMAGLEHPNIVELLALQDDAEELCLVLELVDGLDLDALLRHAPLSVPVALHIGRAVFEALAHAHERGVVHRDVSPANVLIARSGDVKLTDFGVAKLIGDAPTTGSALRATLPYISAEQLQGHPADHRSDLFAAGVLLYQLLTGRSPFGETTNDALRAILQGEYRSASQDAPWLSATLDDVLRQLLAPLDERFQTAEDVLAALPIVEQGRDALVRTLTSVPLRPVRKRRQWLQRAVGVAAVVSVMFALLWHSSSLQPAPGHTASAEPQSIQPVASEPRRALSVGSKPSVTSEPSEPPMNSKPTPTQETDSEELVEQQSAPHSERAQESQSPIRPSLKNVRRALILQPGVLVSP